MIDIKEFDEIVINNPFLTNGTVGYGIRNHSWQYIINYSPNSINLHGQDNSTCKYFILENDETGICYKIIREDKYIEIIEIYKQKEYSREIVTDKNKLTNIINEFIVFKKLVNNQIDNYYTIIRNIQNDKIIFDYESTNKFLSLLKPSLSENQIDKVLKSLKRFEKNPMKYFNDPIDTIHTPSDNIKNTIFINTLIRKIENTESILVIDWNSPFDEVNSLFNDLFKSLGIHFRENIINDKNYNTHSYLNEIIDILLKNDYNTYNLDESSDTYMLVFTKKINFRVFSEYGLKLNIELKPWK